MNKEIKLIELSIKRIYRLNISKECKEFIRKSYALLFPNLYTKEFFINELRFKDIYYIIRDGIKAQKTDDKVASKIRKFAKGKRRELKKLIKFLDENNYFLESGESLIDLT